MNLVKENLSTFIPSLVELIGENDFPWEAIDKKFNKKIDNILASSNGDVISIETSIFNQIISIKQGKSDYRGFLDYYNKLFSQLNILLDKHEKKCILQNIKNLLMSFDLKYLDFLGELSVLYKLKASKRFNLLGTETLLPNNKRIDFDMEIPDSKMRVLIEVLNIQIKPNKVVDNEDEIRQFFEYRIIKKLEDKKSNLTEDWNIHLVPVLWGDHEKLEIYSRYFKKNKFDLPLAYEPLAFITYTDQKEYFEPHFLPLSQLFKD